MKLNTVLECLRTRDSGTFFPNGFCDLAWLKKSLTLNLYFKALHHLSNRNLAHQAWNCFECLWPWRCCHICNSRKHYAEMPQKCYLSPNFNLLDNSPVCKRIFPPAILDAKSKMLLTIFPKAMILEFSTCCIFQNKKYLQNLPS